MTEVENVENVESRSQIARRLTYYNRLIRSGKTLNESQTAKFEQYKQMIEKIDKNKKPHMTPEEYFERNRKNSNARYYRIKNDDELNERMKQQRRDYYLKRKEKMNKNN